METCVSTVTHNIIVLLPGTTGSSLVDYDTLKSSVIPVIAPTWPDLVLADLYGAAKISEILGKVGLPGVTATAVSAAKALLEKPGLQQDPTGASNPLVAYEPYPGFSELGKLTHPVYEPLITYLQDTVLGNAPYYTWNIVNQSVPNATGNLLVGFGYDWRQNNTYTAQQLAALLNNIYDTYSANTGSDFRIILLGHSMGGLVARAYLENVGPANGDKVLGKIAALITLGTPHLGAHLALDSLVGNTLSSVLPVTLVSGLVNDANFPSTYELLPNANCPAFAADGVTRTGSFVTDRASADSLVSVYSGTFSETLTGAAPTGFAASSENLASAQTFFDTLGKQPAGTAYYVLYGLTNDAVAAVTPGTLTSFTWTPGSGTPGTVTPVYTDYSESTTGDNVPTNIWTGGDGIVPVWSAIFAGNSNVTSAPAVGATHLSMPSDTTVQAQIKTWYDAITA
jgi:pimeloyl-ACP methyl ester carboxylesterase